jgi:hypothetical protein
MVASAAAQAGEDLRREHALAVIELQPQIDQAIERGVRWLIDHQQRDGSFDHHGDKFYGGQTALSAYTMMKAGLPPSHPSVRRALLNLTTVQPTKVYTAGAMLMALAESRDADLRPQMEKLVAQLLEWQQGSWPYPQIPGEGGLHADQDLSITQFALLGLRAASRAGVKVPAQVWSDALRTTLRYQDRTRTVELVGKKVDAAGFHYHLSGGEATGSMTTAGLSALWIAREGLGKVPGDLARDVDAALLRGRAWLEANFNLADNPAFPQQRWLYYLYGLERASALLGLAYWADQPWYLEGARLLLAKQGGNGVWAFPEGESDTCFAILFLKRATAASTGRSERAPRVLNADRADRDAALRAVGGEHGTPFTLFLTRVGSSDGTRSYAVEQVEYLAGDSVIATVKGSGAAWINTQRCEARWQPAERGKVQLSARLTVKRLDAGGLPVGDSVTVSTSQLTIDVLDVMESWMPRAATWRARNEMPRSGIEASASSQHDDGHRPEAAADGREGTAWVCAGDDPAPRLVLTLDKPAAARFLVLSQASGTLAFRNQFAPVATAQVFVNGSKTGIAVTFTEGQAPTRIDLGKSVRVKKLEIAITARRGPPEKGTAGLAEVALEKEPK